MKSFLLAAVVASGALASSVDTTFNTLSEGTKSLNQHLEKEAISKSDNTVSVKAAGLVQTWLLRSQNILSDDLDCTIPVS